MPGASLAADVPPEPPCFNHTPQTAGVGRAAGCWHPWPARGGRGKAKQIREGATMRKPVSMKALEKLGRVRQGRFLFCCGWCLRGAWHGTGVRRERG